MTYSTLGESVQIYLQSRVPKKMKTAQTFFAFGFAFLSTVSQAHMETSRKQKVSPVRKRVLFIIRSLLSQAFKIIKLNSTLEFIHLYNSILAQ